MKREKNLKTAKFIEALEHIDPKYVEEAGKKIKERPTGQTVAGMSRAKSLRQVLALVACVLLLSAIIPAVTYLMGHLPDILGSSTGDNTTEQTAPETPPEETTVPAPETTVTETTLEETTAPETTAEETTAEETTAPPEPEYDGSRGLEYRIEGDHAVLVGIGTCTDKDIVTATTYNGLPVTGIDSFEISGNKGITSVTVSEGVTHIEVCAFSGCPDLRAVYLPSTLQFLSAGEGIAFENCDNIDTIKVADSNPKYYSVGNCLIERGTGNLVLACSKSVLPSDGSIKSIGQFAFGGSDSLEKIVIPEGVTVINPYAFAGCASLKSVTFPDSLTTVRWDAFANCTSLESVKLGDNVTEIGSRVFSGCSSLVDITLPGRVDSFGEEIFAGCPIESIVIPDGVKTLHGGMFANCRKLKSVTLPDGIETIVGFAFAYCSSLEKITLPRSVTKIQGEVFADCSNLTEFTFKGTKAEWSAIEKQDRWNEGCPFTVIHCSDGDVNLIIEHDGSRGLEYRIEGDHAVLVGIGTCTDKEIAVASTYDGLPVTAIGRRAIYSLDGITRVVIPDTVTHLDFMAISHCHDLESIHIPANLTVMEESAIIAFKNLKSITVDPNNPRYYSINNCLIDRETKTLILGCGTSIFLDDVNISAIAPNAFMECTAIESIRIPEGVTKIGRDAFYNCTALKSLVLPESLITIESSAFANCTSLESVNLGSKIEYMDIYAFSECVKLTEIVLPDSLSFLGNYAFQGCTALKRAVLSSNLEILELMIFASCTNLEDVIIPEGVKTISTDAFSNTALKELKLPASIKVIRHGAFGYCDNLMNVSYAGTVTQWISVEKDIGWHTVGTFKKIRCSDGEMKLYSDSKDEGSLGLEYEINTDGKSARLIGEGICTDAKIVVAAKFHGLPVTEIYSVALSNCDFIEEIVIPEGVTVIRNQAFSRCVNLKKITLPSTLEYIYDSAFADCESLVSIVIPREVKLIETWAFRDCKNLTKFTFAGTVAEWNAVQKGLGNNWNDGCPFTVVHCSDGDAELIEYDGSRGLEYWIDGDHAVLVGIGACKDREIVTATYYEGLPVTEIGALAFENVGGFTSITVSEGVTSIGLHAFANCPDLREIYLPSTLDDIYGGEGIAFFGCDALEVISVADNNPKYYSVDNCLIERDTKTLVFGCKNSKIPSGGSVDKIGYFAFSGISSIKEIVFPEGITEIMGSAFSMCNGLEKVTLPKSLKKIAEGAFSSCSSLESIEVGNNVTYIGSSAFAGCTKLKNVTLPKRLDYLGEGVFASTAIESIVIPEGIKEFYGGTFANCRNLKSVSLPAGLERIGGSDFSQCFALQSIIIPEGVTEIGAYTFSSCTNLKEITLPESLISIDYSAFANCTSLESISLPAAVTEIGHDAFRGCTALTEFVFKGDAAAWNSVKKAANWRTETGIEIIKCSDREVDAGYTQPDYSKLSSVPEVYRNIIENKTSFYYCPTGKEIFLDDIVFLFSTREEKITESEVRYSVLDMNGDGDLELVVTNLFDVLVFNEENGTVYCYMLRKNNGWVREIAVDGTFEWREPGYSPADSIIIGRLEFSGTSCKIVEVYRRTNVGTAMEPNYEYYVNKRRVSEGEAKEFRNTIAIDLVCQYLIDRYPLVKD